MLDDHALADTLGRNDPDYFVHHYSVTVIGRKYVGMFDRLASEPAPKLTEPLPGWYARRRAIVPTATDVLAGLPSGPVPPNGTSAEVPV